VALSNRLRGLLLIVGILAGQVCLGEAFGRFGYSRNLTIPGFEIDSTGFRVKYPAADAFKFVIPSIDWAPLSTTASSQTVRLTGGGLSPTRIKVDLWSPGFQMYVEKGLNLKLSSLSCPFLTWSEGSVGDNVPMPSTKWAIISFRDSQPPILFAFMNGEGELVFKGKAGDWTLSTTKPYTGWIRVVAPIGSVPMATNTARTLGQLTSTILKDISRWTQPTPKCLGLSVAGDSDGVTAIWKFDRVGAMLPVAANLAPIGGYPIAVKTGLSRVNMPNECGPVSFSTESSIRIRFPITRIPTGRSLSVGKEMEPPISTASAIDLNSITELALANLVGHRDKLTRDTGEDALNSFLTESTDVLEPFTKQKLPFGTDGKGADLVASHALLMQALYSTVSATSEANSLLTSLCWRRDSYTWQFWAPDAVLSRRVGALAALAGALCPEPERRLDGALFQAGVAAQRGLFIWRRRRDEIDNEPLLIEPMSSLRSTLFGCDPPGAKSDPFIRSLLSEIRVYGDIATQLSSGAKELTLSWDASDTRPMSITLASAYPIEVKPVTAFASFSCKEALGFTVIRCTAKDVTRCEVTIRVPTWASSLPNSVSIPRYSETPR
jgi:hypothetical protein